MLAVSALVLGLALGFACGGSIGRLKHVELKGEMLILVLFVLQAVAREAFMPYLREFGLVVWGATSVALLCLLLINVGNPGAPVGALGVGMNALVILANAGMPVTPPPGTDSATVAASVAASGGFYVLSDERTVLAILGDVLPVAGGLASMGDVLLIVGISVLIASSMILPAHGWRSVEDGLRKA